MAQHFSRLLFAQAVVGEYLTNQKINKPRQCKQTETMPMHPPIRIVLAALPHAHRSEIAPAIGVVAHSIAARSANE